MSNLCVMNTRKLVIKQVCIVVFSVFRDMACSVAGITSDANILTNELRLIAQRYS